MRRSQAFPSTGCPPRRPCYVRMLQRAVVGELRRGRGLRERGAALAVQDGARR
jgi:hypothetical protein